MINNKVLDQCRESILLEIGTLSDLPPELATAIANYYYKFHELFYDMQINPIPTMARDETDIVDGLAKFSHEAERRLAMIKALPNSVKVLRDIDKNIQPNLYRAFLNLLLDVYKYEICNIGKKTGLRRMIERRFKTVNQIPNLVEILKI